MTKSVLTELSTKHNLTVCNALVIQCHSRNCLNITGEKCHEIEVFVEKWDIAFLVELELRSR